MRILHGLAYVDEPAQQLAQFQIAVGVALSLRLGPVINFDGALEAIPFDETHRIKRPAVGIEAKAVHRDDARMFQSPRDLRLQQKAGSVLRMIGKTLLDFLQRNLAVQFLVLGDEDLAKSPLGVRPKDAKARPRRSWRPRAYGLQRIRS